MDDSQLVCPHCQTKGKIKTQRVKRAKRKTATRMLFGAATFGGSLAATGVSKKATVTACHCRNCGMQWDV